MCQRRSRQSVEKARHRRRLGPVRSRRGPTHRIHRERGRRTGHQWTAAGAEQGSCSGTAKTLGIQASVTLRFCKARTCSISIEHRPSSDWSSNVTSLKAKLAAKYGEPKERTRGIPVNCRSEEQFQGCLESRELELRYGWNWPSGEALVLNVGKLDGAENAIIRLVYKRGGSTVDQSAL
jgi:hypothetical protein